MKRIINIAAIVSLILFGRFADAEAQNGINSPYSRYGFGMLSDRSMGFNKAMSGVAQGFRGGQIINMANPAAYSEVDSVTALFDFGLTLQNGNYKLDDMRYNAKNSSLDYIAFHFRAGKNVGIALGVLPFSNVKYNFATASEETKEGGAITKTSTYVGDGGLHQVMLGAGWRFIKNASIGANVSYLYGNYDHTTTMSFSDNTINTIYRSYYADINSYTVDLGTQFWFNLNKKDKLTFGLTYGLGHKINNDSRRVISTIRTAEATLDTTFVKNAFEFPHTFAAGVAYSHTYKWQAGADFELQKWSKCRFPNTKESSSQDTYTVGTGILNDRIKVSVGGAYRPSLTGDNLFQKMQYKAGFYYSQSYANADYTNTLSDKPHEFGLSAGVSIPLNTRHLYVKNNIPVLHVTAQWIHDDIPYMDNQMNKKKTLTENYLKLCLGLTFSERWFNKWKF